MSSITTLARSVNPVRRPVRKPRPKPIRRAKIVGGGNGRYVMLLTVGVLQTGYYVARMDSDFGVAFQLDKFACDGGEQYHVNLNGRESSCTCKGNTYRDRCKHVEALQTLLNIGRLS